MCRGADRRNRRQGSFFPHGDPLYKLRDRRKPFLAVRRVRTEIRGETLRSDARKRSSRRSPYNILPAALRPCPYLPRGRLCPI